MNFLTFMFNRGTRSARVFNMFYHAIWSLLFILHLNGILVINVPDNISPSNTSVLVLCLITVALSAMSMTTLGNNRTLIKYFGLLVGSLCQMFIALKYIGNYPPFSPVVIFNITIAIWFILAAFYIKCAMRRSKEYGVNT